MIVEVAGEERTWLQQCHTISECTYCGSREFKRSKIFKHWYCKGCNENYEEVKPWFVVIHCSKHGQQLRFAGEDDYWCVECEADRYLT